MAAILLLFVAPLFVADVLMGISTLILNGLFLDIPGNLWSAILANAVRAFTYAMLIIATQLFRYNWKLDDAAMVFGAGPVRTFLEITLPNIWPALLGAFIVTFINGGLTGLFLGNVVVDVPLSDTMFVVAHFHMVMGVAPIMVTMSWTRRAACRMAAGELLP